MRLSNFLIFGFILLILNSCQNKVVDFETLDTYVVAVSFDGFRWDYTPKTTVLLTIVFMLPT